VAHAQVRNAGNVGQTPWSARVPLDPLRANISISYARQKLAGGPAADQGVAQQFNAGCPVMGKVALRTRRATSRLSRNLTLL